MWHTGPRVRPTWLREDWTWTAPRTNHLIKLPPVMLGWLDYNEFQWLIQRLNETKEILETDTRLKTGGRRRAKQAVIHGQGLPIWHGHVSRADPKFIQQLLLAMAISRGKVLPGDIIVGDERYIVVAADNTVKLVAMPITNITRWSGRMVEIPEGYFQGWPAYYWRGLIKAYLVDHIQMKVHLRDRRWKEYGDGETCPWAGSYEAEQPELGRVLFETLCYKQAPPVYLRVTGCGYHNLRSNTAWQQTLDALRYHESEGLLGVSPTVEFCPISLLAKLAPTCVNPRANQLIGMAKVQYRGYRWILERTWQLVPPLTRIVLAYC